MRVLLPAIFCLLNVVLSAQTNTPAVLRHQIKFSVLAMFDPYPPSFLFSYEQPFLKHFAIVAEGGPSTAYNGDRLRGYKLRGEVRWYTQPFDGDDRIYVGLQFRYKNYKRHKTDTFCRDDCNFFQVLDYQLHSRIPALHISVGLSEVLGSHFVIDVGAFGGWRWAVRKNTGVPPDARLAEGVGPFINFEPVGRFSTPSIGMVFRLGFGW